jgi:hypothetical protein
MPQGNTTIIFASVSVVLVGAVIVFFWWRAKYGVWAKQRQEKAQDDRKNAVVLKADLSSSDRPR